MLGMTAIAPGGPYPPPTSSSLRMRSVNRTMLSDLCVCQSRLIDAMLLAWSRRTDSGIYGLSTPCSYTLLSLSNFFNPPPAKKRSGGEGEMICSEARSMRKRNDVNRRHSRVGGKSLDHGRCGTGEESVVSSNVDVVRQSAYPSDSERTIWKATTSVAICICSALHPTALRGNALTAILRDGRWCIPRLPLSGPSRGTW